MAIVIDSALRIEPTGAALGADVVGVDLTRSLRDDEIKAIRRGWLENLVLRFRGQLLTDDQLMAVSACFGTLDPVPLGSANPNERDQVGYVTVISNVVVDGFAVGALGAYEALWHTDMSYNEQPPIASLLHALEIPPTGGDTGFTNMYLAYERLPTDLKERIGSLRCTHDASRNSAGELRKGYREVVDPSATPGAVHSLVVTHPETGRKALYLGRRKNAYVHGLSVPDGEALLDRLWAHATQPQFAWYQTWRVGDLIMWDNRCTMHRRDAFDTDARRMMHRTQIKGAIAA